MRSTSEVSARPTSVLGLCGMQGSCVITHLSKARGVGGHLFESYTYITNITSLNCRTRKYTHMCMRSQVADVSVVSDVCNPRHSIVDWLIVPPYITASPSQLATRRASWLQVFERLDSRFSEHLAKINHHPETAREIWPTISPRTV